MSNWSVVPSSTFLNTAHVSSTSPYKQHSVISDFVFVFLYEVFVPRQRLALRTLSLSLRHTHTHTHTHTEEKEEKKRFEAFVNLKSVQHSLVWFAGYLQVT